jgi:hypothetical protein
MGALERTSGFRRSTQKPLSALWNVTRSTVPASTARSGWVEGSGAGMGSTKCLCARVWRASRTDRAPATVDRRTNAAAGAGARMPWRGLRPTARMLTMLREPGKLD